MSNKKSVNKGTIIEILEEMGIIESLNKYR